MPISSGVKLALSIITPTPTFAAFYDKDSTSGMPPHHGYSSDTMRTLKWSISPETKNENVGAKRCSRYAATLPGESTCALNDAMRNSYRAARLASASLRPWPATSWRSAATSTFSLSFCQYVACRMPAPCICAVAIQLRSDDVYLAMYAVATSDMSGVCRCRTASTPSARFLVMDWMYEPM